MQIADDLKLSSNWFSGEKFYIFVFIKSFNSLYYAWHSEEITGLFFVWIIHFAENDFIIFQVKSWLFCIFYSIFIYLSFFDNYINIQTYMKQWFLNDEFISYISFKPYTYDQIIDKDICLFIWLPMYNQRRHIVKQN